MARDLRRLVIPVFLPHRGCPHRCVFCDQGAITGITVPPAGLAAVRKQITDFLAGVRPYQQATIAFYGGNFLGLPPQEVTAFLSEAASFITAGHADVIRCSTRPDTIDNARLALLSSFPVETVELGVQSMDDRVLSASCRGHRSADTVQAVSLLKKRAYQVGIQMMVGLPGDDEAISLDTARQVAALSPDFVRIYPTVVLKNSPLARQMARGAYQPWPLDRTVALVKRQAYIFQKCGIPIIRMGLQATVGLDQGGGILAGPYHPAFGHLVRSAMMLDKAIAVMDRLHLPNSNCSPEVILTVHPHSESRLRGLKNENLSRLQERYRAVKISVVPDAMVPKGEITANISQSSNGASGDYRSNL